MFEVIVDNVGTVYAGPDETVANDKYEQYKRYVDGEGRVWPSESVALFEDGDMVAEYRPRDE